MRTHAINPRLIADCQRLGRLSSCDLLLHRNARLPWFILVPDTGVADLLDLPTAQLHRLLDDAAWVSNYIKQDLGWPKCNTAAIGNLVPQLHLHVVGRRPGDDCWPAPIWGNLEPGKLYAAESIEDLVNGLRARGSGRFAMAE